MAGAAEESGAARRGASGFEHERDPRCSYFEEMSRRCASVEDANADAGRRMECKVLRKLMRRCPGRPVEEVERVEETTSDDASNGIVDFGFAPSMRGPDGGSGGNAMEEFARGFGGGFGGFGGMHPGAGERDGVMDPFDLMQRGIDEIFHELGRATGELFRPAFGGDEGEASRCWPGAREDVPPHYRHRYGAQQGAPPTEHDGNERARRRHWDAYQSEDV